MTTIAEAAAIYAKRGWKPIPVSRKTKKAIGTGWQKRPYDPAQFNGNAQNVGVQFGEVSNGLADVDLDTTTAIGLAPEFLPPTGAIFGHRSKPASHQLYVSELWKTEPRAVIQFREYVGGKPMATLVELRIGGNGKGAASVFPPSMHETGEMVEWVRNGEPANADGNALKLAVTKLAIATLLLPRYPGGGSRHDSDVFSRVRSPTSICRSFPKTSSDLSAKVCGGSRSWRRARETVCSLTRETGGLSTVGGGSCSLPRQLLHHMQFAPHVRRDCLSRPRRHSALTCRARDQAPSCRSTPCGPSS